VPLEDITLTNGTSHVDIRKFTIPDLTPGLTAAREVSIYDDFSIFTSSYNDRFDRSTPIPTEGSLANLADIHLIFHDNCLEPEWDPQSGPPFYKKKEGWRAWKASMRLCVQDLESSFNLTMSKSISPYRYLSC